MKWLRTVLGDLARGLLVIVIIVAIITPLAVAWTIFPGAMLIVTSVVTVLVVLAAIGAILREDGLL